QRESWGGDHLTVAWTRPGEPPDTREILSSSHVSSTGQSLRDLEGDGTLSFRLRVIQVDTDNDGVSDYEEHLLGLDASKPESTPRQPDAEAARSILDSANTVTIGATVPRAYEADATSGRFTIYRAGGISPITVHY